MQSLLTIFVTNLQLGSILSFTAWILIGGLVGLIGSKIINKTGHGRVRDVLLSVFGAMFAGFLTNLLGNSQTAGLDRYSMFVAAVGALVFLITYQGMFRRERIPWEVTLVERFRRRRRGRVEHQ